MSLVKISALTAILAVAFGAVFVASNPGLNSEGGCPLEALATGQSCCQSTEGCELTCGSACCSESACASACVAENACCSEKAACQLATEGAACATSACSAETECAAASACAVGSECPLTAGQEKACCEKSQVEALVTASVELSDEATAEVAAQE